jgi:eukaryotic-like serine/threonine-protein kinase
VVGSQVPTSAVDVGQRRSLGRYELLVPIARGGMAMVWAARLRGSRGFEKLVAVKTMLPGMSDNAAFEAMFLDEAKLASRIRHPHVVEILDLGEEDRILYLVMEWVDGEPLNQIMNEAARRGGVPIAIGVRIVMQACAGLHAAHELKDEDGQPFGLVHRDVSPQNILVTYDGVTKVTDFGIAKAMARGGSSTGVGEVKGKVAYMAPEQASAGKADRRADIFALGIMLYQLATGTHPFRGDTDGETLANILLTDSVAFPRELAPGYPSSLEAVITKALARDPDQRFETASAMMRALDKALPPSMRGSAADEDVGAFVRSLLGESHEARKRELQVALRESENIALRADADTFPPGPAAALDTVGGSALERPGEIKPRAKLAFVAAGALGAAAIAIAIAGRSGPAPAVDTDPRVHTPASSAAPAASPAGVDVPRALGSSVPSASTETVTPVPSASSPRERREPKRSGSVRSRPKPEPVQKPVPRPNDRSPVRTPGF